MKGQLLLIARVLVALAADDVKRPNGGGAIGVGNVRGTLVLANEREGPRQLSAVDDAPADRGRPSALFFCPSQASISVPSTVKCSSDSRFRLCTCSQSGKIQAAQV